LGSGCRGGVDVTKSRGSKKVDHFLTWSATRPRTNIANYCCGSAGEAMGGAVGVGGVGGSSSCSSRKAEIIGRYA
jgi:hypothetical protein